MTRRRVPGFALAVLVAAAACSAFAAIGDLFESTLQAPSSAAIAASPGSDSQPQAFGDSAVDDVLPAEAPPVLAALAEGSCAFPPSAAPVPRRLRLAGPNFERGPPLSLS